MLIVDIFIDQHIFPKYTNQIWAVNLTYGGDRFAVWHNSPGVSKKEATSMKKARSKTQNLLESLLDGSPVASLFKDHLLVGVVLSKRINWNQVRPEETQDVTNPSVLTAIIIRKTMPRNTLFVTMQQMITFSKIKQQQK